MVSFDDDTMAEALATLKDKRLAFTLTGAGMGVPKRGHRVVETLNFAISFRVHRLSRPYVGTAVFDGSQMCPQRTRGHDGPEYLIGGLDDDTLYDADGGFPGASACSNLLYFLPISG
jgi:hypothetical protein